MNWRRAAYYLYLAEVIDGKKALGGRPVNEVVPRRPIGSRADSIRRHSRAGAADDAAGDQGPTSSAPGDDGPFWVHAELQLPGLRSPSSVVMCSS